MTLVQKQVDKFLMNLDLGDGGISGALYHYGGREKAFMSLIRREIEPGMVCYDVGANIGYATLFMLDRVGDEGFVYAIEPDPHNIEMLRKNIKDNFYVDICEITEGAISDHTYREKFCIADKPNLHSVHKTKHTVREIDVEYQTFLDFVMSHKHPDFIKMDVEGHEVEILSNALRYFESNDKPTKILLEVHPQFYSEEHSLAKVMEGYKRAGFNPMYVVSTPVPSPRLFAESGYIPIESVPTDGFVRGIYNDVSFDDLIRFACYENIEGQSKKIVRSFMIGRE